MSLFDEAEKIFADNFSVLAKNISIRRNGTTIADQIPAKLGKTLFRTDYISGVTVRVEQRDFIVLFDDLNGNFPERGDEVIWDGQVYLVTAPEGEPCWKWHTRQSHSQLRIHAKNIGPEDKEKEE